MATRKRPAAPKRAANSTNSDNFNPFAADNRVPGEILVKLSGAGRASVTESIPNDSSAVIASGLAPESFGFSALDKALADFKVSAVTRVHTPMPDASLSGGLEAMGLSGGASTELGAASQSMDSSYRVRLDVDADLDKAIQRLKNIGAEVSDADVNRYRWTSVVPNDPQYGMEWGLVKINCPDAWNKTKGLASVVVAVIDTGIDLDHPDLVANLKLPGRDLVNLVGVSPSPGWVFEGDFLGVDSDPQDEVGHGTHVAGTIAAMTNNAVGVAGVTWNCKLLPVKVLTRMKRLSDGRVTGVGISTDIAAGIRWAADHGAHILNMSLGSSSSTFVESDAVAYAQSKGCLVVAAMGNDGPAAGPSYPAAYNKVFAVGAIQQNEKLASFSQIGAHIDVVAPGVGIRSTDWNNTYSYKDGTSMATPHAAGVAALVKSAKTSLTADEIADIIRTTCKPLKDNPADPIPNNKYGFGLINAKAAVDKAKPTFKLKVLDDPKLKFVDDPKLKAADDPKLKVADDPKLKVLDDPKLKFKDDPKLKVADDPKQKVADDPKLKIADDPKLKVADDPKLKITDDPKPKIADDPQKGLFDNIPIGPGIVRPGAAPFILATPHHAEAGAASEAQSQLGQIQQSLAAYQQAYAAGQLDEEGMQQLQQLYDAYLSVTGQK
jgi:hypothetical protein